ncbi:MAG: phosphodiesterase [Bacilli bacterium]
MNILIGSDIHGSKKYAEMFFGKAEKFSAGKIILLGDFYYNGARNTPPEEYSPKEVVQLCNSYADRIIAVKGNCESEVDTWVSEFPISEMAYVSLLGKEMILTHGHHYSFDNLPKGKYDIFFQGHTHISVLEKKDGIILANPGSISLPKDDHHSYMVMNDKGIRLLDLLDDSLIKEIEF